MIIETGRAQKAWFEWGKHPDAQRRMVHEESPDQIVSIAEAIRLDPIRQQKQARILNASTGQNKEFCPDFQLPVRPDSDASVVHDIALPNQLQQCRIKINAN